MAGLPHIDVHEESAPQANSKAISLSSCLCDVDVCVCFCDADIAAIRKTKDPAKAPFCTQTRTAFIKWLF